MSTERTTSLSVNPRFNFTRAVAVEVSPALLDYFASSLLEFDVYGREVGDAARQQATVAATASASASPPASVPLVAEILTSDDPGMLESKAVDVVRCRTACILLSSCAVLTAVGPAPTHRAEGL